MKNKQAPVFLDLRVIRMPAAAIVSIGHRISGVLIALIVPFCLYLFDLSLSGQTGFDEATALMENPTVRFILFFVCWGFMHHLYTGIRFLFTDIHIGVDKQSGRITALAALIAAPVTAAITVGLLI